MKLGRDRTGRPETRGDESEGSLPLDPIVVERVRRRLRDESGPRFWRSLEELAGTAELRELVEREFPRYAPAEWEDGTSRRDFLQLAAASMALAGLTACTRQPQERIVPYVEQPENVVPGKPLYYSTAMSLDGYGSGLLAESHLGRPTKLDGNPLHPASLGATDVLAQAEVLSLYDPDRSTAIVRLGQVQTWKSFAQALEPALQAQQALFGKGLRILTPPTSSPSFAAQLEAVRARFPEARWHQWASGSRQPVRRGAELAFGEVLETRYDLERADVVVSLGADLLHRGPGHLRYARDFMARRRLRDGSREMNRLYVLETSPTPTGTVADHRLPVREAELERFAVALAARLGVPGVGASASLDDATLGAWLDALGEELRSHPGRSLVAVGDELPPEVHALGHAINAHLGNAGETVLYTDPVLLEPTDEAASLAELVEDMDAGRVDVLLVLGANPVYDAPADLDVAAAMLKVNLRVHSGLYRDETSEYCQWHVPAPHFLERWADVRAFDGTATVAQPLILPLYDSRSDVEILSLLGGELQSDYELVRATWEGRLGEDFEAAWRRAVHDGVVAESAYRPRTPTLRTEGVAGAASALAANGERAESVELQLRLDTGVFDGRYANNGWLQELPKPITLLTWDNAALTSPATAERLGLRSGQVVRLSRGERSLEVPVLVVPGQADGSLSLSLGYGRRRAGRVGNGVGVDAGALRTSSTLWRVAGVEVEPTGRSVRLATTQSHHDIDQQIEQVAGRHLIRQASLEHYRRHPDFAQHAGPHVDTSISLFPAWEYEGYSWGMAIDLGACTGCSACVLACQSENNIPIVGKEGVLVGREMHWLRIDRYYEGRLDDPQIHHQPVTCMHCEKAPCEVVCPVAATVHGDEGLNEMIYNRCVGTRYCSNNCPYKVRRFNFFKYTDWETPILRLGRNPDVTVRSRGVMEKCTYCVQRINHARIEAKKERRKIRDGEVRTACQEACPTRAIAFGDLNDPESEVNRWKSSSLNFTLLDELATLPRTSYLAKVRNPNPALVSPEGAAAGGDEH